MEVKNNPLLGDMKMEWTFPQDMDQEKMMEKMINDQMSKMQEKVSRYE